MVNRILRMKSLVTVCSRKIHGRRRGSPTVPQSLLDMAAEMPEY